MMKLLIGYTSPYPYTDTSPYPYSDSSPFPDTTPSPTFETTTEQYITSTQPVTQPPTTQEYITTTQFVQQSSTNIISTGYPCSGIIFVGEFTKILTNDSKAGFLRLAKSFSNQVSNLQFALSQFGTNVYRRLNLQNYTDFQQTVTTALQQYLQNDQPDGNLNYLGDALKTLNDFLMKYPQNKFAVLFMSELETMRDPSAARTYARQIIAANTNLYVLDYSTGVVPSIWTGLRPNHLLNGTNLTFDQIYSFFSGTLINDFYIQNC
uniref:VWFA domain-containing protein n=1 Tax=Panagrolaimus sp. JU765 TaxID=591449 RepID=A0AC34RB34_9BILA